MKFEYFEEDIRGNLIESLNKLGEQGWEAVSIHRYSYPDYTKLDSGYTAWTQRTAFLVVFKRQYKYSEIGGPP